MCRLQQRHSTVRECSPPVSPVMPSVRSEESLSLTDHRRVPLSLSLLSNDLPHTCADAPSTSGLEEHNTREQLLLEEGSGEQVDIICVTFQHVSVLPSPILHICLDCHAIEV